MNKKIMIGLSIILLVCGCKNNNNNITSNEEDVIKNEEQINTDDSFVVEDIVNKLKKSYDVFDGLSKDGSSYVGSKGRVCMRYNADDEKEMIDLLKEIYISPFREGEFFELVTSVKDDNSTEEKLYVCLPENCQVEKVVDYKILSEQEESKVVKLGKDYSVALVKYEGEWKFILPVIMCQNED